MKRSIYLSLIVFCVFVACQKSEKQDFIQGEETIDLKVAASLPEVKALDLVNPSSDNIYALSFNNPSEQEFSYTSPYDIENSIYYYTLPAGTESVIFTNLVTGWDNYYLYMTKDFESESLIFTRNQYYAYGDLVVGGARISDIGEDGVLRVHLKRLVCFVTATLKFVDKDNNVLPFSDYTYSAAFVVPNQAKSVACDVAGNITISETPFDSYDVGYFANGNICTDQPMFPTAQGLKGKIEVRLKYRDDSIIYLRKDLDYAFEPNKHYVLSITVRRNDTPFDFSIESIVSETIDMPLN